MSAIPTPLATAIDTASKQSGVPADILTGIWEREDGSYPNDYVNKEGYGGLFGTQFGTAGVDFDLDGGTTGYSAAAAATSPQTQADDAADTLAADIKAAGGSLSGGLLKYSGNSYDVVPGETTAQVFDASDGSLDSLLHPIRLAQQVASGASQFANDASKYTPSAVAGDAASAAANAVTGALGTSVSGIESGAATGLAYVVLTLLGVALVLLGLLDALGYSPSRVAGGVAKAAVPEAGDIPF